MPIKPKSLQVFLEKSCEQFRHKLVKEYDININVYLIGHINHH